MNVRKNDQNFIAFCDELRAYVLENRHFPNKHTWLLNKIKFIRRKINQGTLEEWKLKMFLDIAGMRDMDGYTGGRKKKQKVSYVCLFRHKRKYENILPENSNHIS